jgi:hypothetical protein
VAIAALRRATNSAFSNAPGPEMGSRQAGDPDDPAGLISLVTTHCSPARAWPGLHKSTKPPSALIKNGVPPATRPAQVLGADVLAADVAQESRNYARSRFARTCAPEPVVRSLQAHRETDPVSGELLGRPAEAAQPPVQDDIRNLVAGLTCAPNAKLADPTKS